MEMKVDPSKVLMSEALRGQVPVELEDEAVETLGSQAVTVVAAVQIGDTKTAIVGLLRSVLFEAEPELEFRVTLDEAFNMIEAQQLQFLGFELHYGDRIIRRPGPLLVKGVRIDDIDTVNQLCTLSLGLKRPPKA
jgi:hypothetical protein